MMDRYPESDPLAREKNEVLACMSGCADPKCVACAHNKEAIDALVVAVVKSIQPVRATS